MLNKNGDADAVVVFRRERSRGISQQKACPARAKDCGVPERARAFKALLGEYDGVMIVTPEYNAGIPGLLKNTLDWVSRVGTEPNVYRTRVFAISGTSPGYYGAMRSLLQLREVLAVGLGATVIPQQMALPGAMKAFAEDGSLVDDARQKMFADVVEALAVAARKFAA